MLILTIAAVAAVLFCSVTAFERDSYMKHRFSVKPRHASQYRDYNC